jgi:hypothetical protein
LIVTQCVDAREAEAREGVRGPIPVRVVLGRGRVPPAELGESTGRVSGPLVHARYARGVTVLSLSVTA